MKIAVASLLSSAVIAASAVVAKGDYFSVSAGVYKFWCCSGEPFWRVQNQISGGLSASIDADWTIPANEWGDMGGGLASAKAEPGKVEATGVSNTNYRSGGTAATASAWVDDLVVTNRLGDNPAEVVLGVLRVTVSFDVQISLTNMPSWNYAFTGSRIEWQVLVRDVNDVTDSGWSTRNGEGGGGSPWQVVGKKTHDIPVLFPVGTPLEMNLSLKNETQGTSTVGANSIVFSIGGLELGEAPNKSGARLAIILPPEYRADSVKWGIVDGMYTPPGAVQCPSDLDATGAVDTGDVSLLLLQFGDCVGGAPDCEGDLDGTGSVDTADLSLMLLDFGDCP